MATSTPPTSSTPHRASVNGACTHLTMTRLWSDVFLCQICLQRPTFGWLYRCTQDSELLIDDDLEIAGTRKLDQYCDIFERPPTSRKRSPAARMSKLSFLEETSDQELKSYTPEQINKILAQRAHILETAQEQELQEQGFGLLMSNISPSSILTKLTKRTDSPSRKPSQPSAKPWLPKKECQFKCCHHCRPNLVERTFLSLDGVAKGDLPATAISGWGFQLRLGKQKRPIGLVKHVKNLGLRPSPPPRSESPFSDRILLGWSDRSRRRSTSPDSLGTRSPLVAITSPNPVVDTSIITTIGTQSLHPLPSPPTNIQKDTKYNAEAQEIFQRMTMGSQRQILPQIPSRNSHHNNTQENIQTQDSSVSFDLATSTPLPPPGDDEIFPPTPMMQHEWDFGSFGSGPLEVKSGVAVTEEAVELNVPDLIISEDEHFWRNGS